MTADYVNPFRRQPEALHLLVRRSGQDHVGLPRLGCNHASVALYDSNVEFECALRLSSTQIDELNIFMKDLPFSKFPEVPKSRNRRPQAFPRSSVVFSFDMRVIDYKQYKQQVADLFKEFQARIHGTTSVYVNQVDVARKLSLVTVHVQQH